MAIFVKHVACPKCNSRNNLAMYDDGSGWCFGCHYVIPSQLSGFVRQQQKEQDEEPTWSLPDDLTQDFPEEVLTYIQQYDITIEELIKYGYYFSKRTGRLWTILGTATARPVCGGLRSGECSAEARSCNGSPSRAPKALFFGSKEDTFAFTGTEHPSRHLVLCEDRLSSIKIGRVTHAMALFGTSISMPKTTKLAQSYKKVTIWLDRDKFKEAWEIALKFKWLGVHTNVVLTALDPKAYSAEEITEYLNGKK